MKTIFNTESSNVKNNLELKNKNFHIVSMYDIKLMGKSLILYLYRINIHGLILPSMLIITMLLLSFSSIHKWIMIVNMMAILFSITNVLQSILFLYEVIGLDTVNQKSNYEFQKSLIKKEERSISNMFYSALVKIIKVATYPLKLLKK